MFSLLEDVSSHLISHQDSTTATHADISAFWLALAQEGPQPDVATSAMQWLVHAAWLCHSRSAEASAQAAQPNSTTARLAHRLARVQLIESEGSVSVRIVSSEAESDREQRNAVRAHTSVAAAVRTIAQLSRAPSPAMRLSAAQSALQLLTSQRPSRPQQQASSEHKAAGSEPSNQHATSTNASAEPGSSAARRAVLLRDSALVQLGQAAMAGVSDVSTDVAAAWHQVLDRMAPAIMRIATSASRTTLPAFLLLHEVRLSSKLGCMYIWSQARDHHALLGAGWCEGAL